MAKVAEQALVVAPPSCVHMHGRAACRGISTPGLHKTFEKFVQACRTRAWLNVARFVDTDLLQDKL